MTELLIDATALGDDSAHRGIGTYLRHLLEGAAATPELALSALVRRGTPLPSTVRRVEVHRVSPGRFRRLEHDVLLPFDLRRWHGDVFHSPALDPPRRTHTPWVQTIHDLIPLVFNDPDLAVERRIWRRQARRYRRAAAIIAVSQYTARQATSLLDLDPRHVEVIPHGVGAEFSPEGDRAPSLAPYLLSVGEYSRRKGYREAFAVIGALAEAGYPHCLRISGRQPPWLRPAVDDLITAAPRPERIELLGYVDDLPSQYRGAALLLMTSRYEGFGLPVIEAMACGTPVVAFDNSSITEIVGDAGILVPDGDLGAMVRGVRMLLDDPVRWRDLSEQGLERARHFSWDKSIAHHVDVYHGVVR